MDANQKMSALRDKIERAATRSRLEPDHVIAVLMAQIANTVQSLPNEAQRCACAESTMSTLDTIFSEMLPPCDDPDYVKPVLTYGAEPFSFN
jgi:hypothetical protein